MRSWPSAAAVVTAVVTCVTASCQELGNREKRTGEWYCADWECGGRGNGSRDCCAGLSEVGLGRLPPMRTASSVSCAPARYFWVSSETRTRFRGGFLVDGARVVALFRFEGGP